ncbi:amidohydrolase [Leucobacter soli]|uniref:N-substituted formamide deformylase n=1 Tax=Leucobacter soli TaxID=2812850 RepID=A0A916JVP9_9MICO|nr:amidohydrolase [Leucobacter soli]CAG7608275.1 N-substituted formamide deformylase [Leucobacter soli]
MLANADLVFRSGTVFTAADDPELSSRRSVAVGGGQVLAVGRDSDIEAFVGAGTEIVELDGGMLIPGFQDAHVHPFVAGVEMLQCDLADAAAADACLDIVAAYAAAHPDEEWIVGGGWEMGAFPGGTPRREALDAVVRERPVALYNKDHHGVWVNSRALELAGVTAATPDPADGRIERDPDGTPSGTLHEGAASLIERVRPPVSTELMYRGFLRAQQELLRFGVTAIQDAWVGEAFGLPDSFPVYERLVADEALRIRVSGALWWERGIGAEQIVGHVERQERARALASPDRFACEAIKIMADGVAENFTASVTEPYLDRCGNRTDNLGIDFVDPELLKEYAVALDSRGFQLHFHALGDRAVRQSLDAIEHAREVNGIRDARHHLAHIQMVHPADIARFALLGAGANMQPLWAAHSAQVDELTLPFLAPLLVRQQYPFGDLLRAGARLIGGSDWPVSSPNPILGIHVAVNRREPGVTDGPPLGDQAIPVARAIEAYTAGSSWATRFDATGSIEPGATADLVALDTDLLACRPEDIWRAQARETFVGGARE